MSHHKLEFKNVHFAYPDGNKAINDVSFCIRHGESVGIIGANGAGKSTLLMLMMGIIFAGHGEILVGDTHVTKKTLPMIRQRLGMVFQNSDDQLFMTTVYDDVAFGPRNYKMDEEDVAKKVNYALEVVGIQHLKDRAPFKLSGGEKRSVSIATVLSMQPDILIMDEPTSSLDPKSRRKVIDLLKSFEHTKIITSHDLDMVYEVCNRVIVLKDGSIMSDGAAEEILTNGELLEKCGLEVPLSLKGCPKCGSTIGRVQE